MNIKKLQILLFISFFLVLSCNHFKEKTVIGEATNCKSLSDAIIKFKKINEINVADAILDYAKSENIEFINLEEIEVSNWINNVVFSNQRDYSLIKEWNIDDEDICFIQKSTITSAADSSKTGNSVEIKICNTILTQDVSAGSFWSFDSKNFSVNIQYCFDNISYIKRVGYYEVVEKNKQLERSLKTNLSKYHTLAHINLKFFDKRSNTEFHRQILSDNGFLYTGMIDLHKK
jgi:hypothetical protein